MHVQLGPRPKRGGRRSLIVGVAAVTSVVVATIVAVAVRRGPPASLPPGLHRPGYHFTAVDGWLNDPYGYYRSPGDGLYHQFYQRNARSTAWGPPSWGHATSPDLVKWCASGRSAVAVAPTPGLPDAGGCWDGRVLADPTGRAPAVAIYTGVVRREPPNGVFDWRQSQMLMRAADASLGSWRKEARALLTDAELPRNLTAFRDPFVVPVGAGGGGGHAMLVASGYENGSALYAPDEAPPSVLLYGTKDPELLRWEANAAGPLFVGDPVADGHNYECANVFWLPGTGAALLTIGNNRDRRQLYVVGEWYAARGNASGSFPPFRPADAAGTRVMDHGNLYAVSGLALGDGTVVVVGWSDDDPARAAAQGWAGALSVPREVRSDPRDPGGVLQAPLAALKALRRPAGDGGWRHVWVEVDVAVGGAGSLALEVLGGVLLSLRCAASGACTVCVGGACMPAAVSGGATDLVVLADASVVEVFAGGGRSALTARVYPDREARKPRLTASGGNVAAAGDVRVWSMGSIWDESC